MNAIHGHHLLKVDELYMYTAYHADELLLLETAYFTFKDILFMMKENTFFSF